MQTVQHVTGVATQGNSAITYGDQWTTSFQLQTSQDGRSWATFGPRGSELVYLEGNKDKNSVVYHAFEPPLAARYVRLCPKSWNDTDSWNVPCLRWEVFTLEGRGDAFDWLRERGGAVVRRRPWHDRAREGALWIHAPADVIGGAPVWQGETPVFPQEGAPVMGCAVAKVVGEAAPQHEEMAREASKMIIKITSVDHDSGRVGMYFNFNRNDVGLEIRDPRRRDDDGHNARHRKTMYIMVTHAPANGGKRQTGQVVVWGNKRGGSTGDAHGRFNSRPIKPAVRQFSVGDILVVESIHFREKDGGAPPPAAASSCACQIL